MVENAAHPVDHLLPHKLMCQLASEKSDTSIVSMAMTSKFGYSGLARSDVFLLRRGIWTGRQDIRPPGASLYRGTTLGSPVG